MKKLARVVRRSASLLDRRAWRHRLVGPTEFWKMKRDFQISFLRARGLQPHHRLLDIGCGTLRGGIALIEYLETSHYYGIELRAITLAEGLRELCDAGLEDKSPTLIMGEVGSIAIPATLDFVLAFSVLIHMPDDVLEETLAFVSRQIGPGGAFYANVNADASRDEGSWQGYPVVSRSLGFYEDACGPYGLVVEDLGELGALGHNTGVPSQDSQRMLCIRAEPACKAARSVLLSDAAIT